MNSHLGKALMVQGTASYAGKTTLVAGLCGILARQGYRVAPFKAQNMSLNSYVTPDGREIARAQALQAFAAGIEPRAEMNPILLKPKGEMVSQVVLMGRPYKDFVAKDHYGEFAMKEGLSAVRHCLGTLLSEFDVVVIEGAGSPAELNLYERDIANMRVAELVGAAVFLVADIDRGGVFASVYGTISLLKARHRPLVKGILINKFRGDLSILRPGLRELERLTGRPVLGIIPYIKDLELPWEDSMSLSERMNVSKGSHDAVDIAVIRLPFISNFTDFHPLMVAGARVRLVDSSEELGEPDAVIIPGTKNTVHDLLWMGDSGVDKALSSLRRRGVPIVGVCGGYQMMGRRLIDPKGLEGGEPGEYNGLGFIDSVTTFVSREKTTERVTAEVTGGGPVAGRVHGKMIGGYEIHMGDTKLYSDGPLFKIILPRSRQGDAGAISQDGLVMGSYLHGMFDDGVMATAIIGYLSERRGVTTSPAQGIEGVWAKSLSLLYKALDANVDLARMFQMAGIVAK